MTTLDLMVGSAVRHRDGRTGMLVGVREQRRYVRRSGLVHGGRTEVVPMGRVTWDGPAREGLETTWEKIADLFVR